MQQVFVENSLLLFQALLDVDYLKSEQNKNRLLLWKSCTQYASKFWKLKSGYRTGKGQFSFQFQREPMPKNPLTTAQVHLSHMLAK